MHGSAGMGLSKPVDASFLDSSLETSLKSKFAHLRWMVISPEVGLKLFPFIYQFYLPVLSIGSNLLGAWHCLCQTG
jgi:hypothetical protein